MPKTIDKEINRANIGQIFTEIDSSLAIASSNSSFENATLIAKSVMGLLGFDSETINQKLVRFDKLQNPSNDSWTKKAPGYADRKASYELASDNDKHIDFKIYWAKKANKRTIANLVALTPNFEDEDIIYLKKNIGIDFVVPDDADRLIVILSNNYKMRTLELHQSLTNTQKEIFKKWAQVIDFDNKAQLHQILWDSFDIHPLNKEFYKEIATLFTEQVQHLLSKNILDEHHAKQFTTRLIGRLIFCWFLRKKNIIAEEFEYFEPGDKDSTVYYQEKLERLFFEVLNTPLNERETQYSNNKQQLKLVSSQKPQKTLFEIDPKTPFLNGGLFEPKESDLYSKNEVSFPADYFKRFIKDFLETYNFTTDESTSDFQQVAIDPEMLGRIFENLLAEQLDGDTGEQARRAKGTFYTPREIVDYMCRESLRQYLSTKLGEDTRKDNILSLLLDKKEHEFDYKNDSADIKPYKATLVQALDDLKILDPACGSGAFPIGMLQIILSTYTRLDRRYESYTTKKEIIHETLYGIDIEPTAVEIARLRTWLSLIVDVELKPNASNFGIDPLPNLDFKFVCANSLIPLAPNGQQSIFDDAEFEKSIQDIREEYFASPPAKRKKQLQSQFETLVGDNLLYNNGNGMSERQKQLRTYHPFDSENVVQFFDNHFMFGVDGFDIVIGNPPYDVYQGEKKDQIAELLKYPIYEIAKGRKLNAYKVFIARSIDFLKTDGILCQIFQNSFLCDDSATKLREYFFNKQQIIYIDSFPERDDPKKRVFESAKMSVCILLARNIAKDFYAFKVNFWEDKFKMRGCTVDYTNEEIREIDSNKYIIPHLSNKEKEIFLKHYNKQKNMPLGIIAECLEGELNMTFHKKYFTDNTLNPKIIKGAQVQRFHITDEPSQGKVEYVDKKRYLKEHCGAKSKHHNYKRIVMQGITGANDKIRLVMSIIEPNFFCANSCNYILIKEDYRKEYSEELLLAFLCSKFVNWIFRKSSTNSNVNCYEIESLMVPQNISIQKKQELESLIKEILVAENRLCEDHLAAEEKINSIVYELYGITDTERALIEESLAKRVNR